jgi:hypothetical protein
VINRFRRGQSTVEYTILIIIVCGAFLAMNQYLKRGVQGRWKSTLDDFGDQYDPRLINSLVNHTIVSTSNSTVEMVPGSDPSGVSGYYTNRVDQTHSVETKTGSTAVGAFDANGLPANTQR